MGKGVTVPGKSKPILCLDFDGVCHSYDSGYQGITNIPDPPVVGLFEFLQIAMKHFEIHVYSTRSKAEGGRAAMEQWFYNCWRAQHFPDEVPEPYFLNELHFPKTKPPAFVTLDDRVLTFTGVWPSVDTLLNFKPWNKQ